jgi:hypothetical protein
MKYRILMSIEVEAAHDREAYEHAKALKKLLQEPIVKMAVENKGIRLSGNGNPVVHRPIYA